MDTQCFFLLFVCFFCFTLSWHPVQLTSVNSKIVNVYDFFRLMVSKPSHNGLLREFCQMRIGKDPVDSSHCHHHGTNQGSPGSSWLFFKNLKQLKYTKLLKSKILIFALNTFYKVSQIYDAKAFICLQLIGWVLYITSSFQIILTPSIFRGHPV